MSLTVQDSVNVVHREPIYSTSQIDMGLYGENPRERGIIVDKSNVQGTTKDLFRGTAKASIHIPGYEGFIANAVDPQFGTIPERPGSGTLRMTYKPSVPGYTGHYQKECETVRVPKAGKDTTSGASQLLVKKSWAKRGVKLD
jgi:hypothetical protein